MLINYYYPVLYLHRVSLLRQNKVPTSKLLAKNSTLKRHSSLLESIALSSIDERFLPSTCQVQKRTFSIVSEFLFDFHERRRCRDAQLNWDSRIYIGLLPSPALWQRTRGGFDGIDFPKPGTSRHPQLKRLRSFLRHPYAPLEPWRV